MWKYLVIRRKSCNFATLFGVKCAQMSRNRLIVRVLQCAKACEIAAEAGDSGSGGRRRFAEGKQIGNYNEEIT